MAADLLDPRPICGQPAHAPAAPAVALGPARAAGSRRRVAARRAFLLIVLLPLLAGCVHHTVRPGLVDGGPVYDLRHPPCDPAGPPADSAPADAALVRYLGSGGLYVRWQGEAVLISPFFSNPSLLRVGLGRMRPRPAAVERGLDGLDLAGVGAVLVGHSHYDHLGDLPLVAERLEPRAALLVNAAGALALQPYEELRRQVTVLEERPADGFLLHDAAGKPLPFRLCAVPSAHAPHALGITVMNGPARDFAAPWERYRYWRLRTGRPHAFVLDLLERADEAAASRFRILYFDAAADLPESLPPAAETAYDLAVLCMASASAVPPYPERLVAELAPRHVLAIHWENFMAPWERRRGFVPLLTRTRAETFLREVEESHPDGGRHLAGPESSACGPAGVGWTMPLVGEWSVFHPSKAP